MPLLRFGNWRPDATDIYAAHTQRISNCIPAPDGSYGPWSDLETFTQPLPAAPRGYFVARRSDASVAIFAGTADRLYLLSNTTLAWSDVSKDGNAYTTLSPTARWSFAQFGNFVIAVQRNVAPQVFDLSSSAAFDDLAGTPPQAGFVAVVGRFLVLCDLLANPFRIAWSGLNDVTEWTPGSNNSDVQDFPSGGVVLGVAELSQGIGMILQESAIRRMMFAPGSPEVFQIDRLTDDFGILAPYSLTVAGGFAFFLSGKGFIQASIDGGFSAIGEEMVDQTFLGRLRNAPAEIADAAYDASAPQLIYAASDPQSHRVLWAYKSVNGATELADRVLVYQYTRQRWSPVSGLSLAGIAQLMRPGMTLEGLDAIAPGAQTITGAADNGSGAIRLTVGSTAGWSTGDWKTISGVTGTTEANGTWQITVVDATHIDLDGSTFTNAYTAGGLVGGSLDALPFSLDDVANASLPGLSGWNSNFELGFFTGATLEAHLETPEQSLDGFRININGFRPITDAPVVYGSTGTRDNLNADVTYGTESEMDADGNVPLLDEGRYARGVVRIPAGTGWTWATGIEPDFGRGGRW